MATEEEAVLNWKEFCGKSEFWDPSLLNATWPDVSSCFQETVLSWLPLAYLWLVSPFYLRFMSSHDGGCISISRLHRAKMVLCVLLFMVSLIEVGYTIARMYLNTQTTAPVYLVTPTLFTLTMMLVFFLIHTERIRGVYTSGILFCFWLLLAICGLAEFNSKLLEAVTGEGDRELDVFLFVAFYLTYGLVLAQLVCFSIADNLPQYSKVRSDPNPCPEASASFLSRLTFWWFTRMVLLGYKRALTTKDLWGLLDKDKAANIMPRFLREWDREREPRVKAKHKGRTRTLHVASGDGDRSGIAHSQLGGEPSDAGPGLWCRQGSEPRPQASLFWAIVRTFGATFLVGSALRLVTDILVFASPELLKLLIRYTEDRSFFKWQGYMYAVLIFLAAVLQSLLQHQHYHIATTVGMQLRTALTGAVYRKSLVLSNAARRSTTVGEIVNLMSVDTQRCLDLCTYLDTLWSSPLQIGVALYLLWQVLGPSVMAGFAITIFMIPINAVIAIKMRSLQTVQMQAKDTRIKLMNEVLSGIKVLKLYAWETSFCDKVMDVRGRELSVMLRSGFLASVLTFLWSSTPFLVLATTFAVYVLSDENNVLDAEKAFVSLSLFNILRLPLSMLPNVIAQFIQASVSIKRIQKFLKSEELDPNIVSPLTKELDQAILVEKADFAWSKDESPLLKNISLEVKDGSLVAVVGQVGAGKSSLLCALLGEMERLQGTVAVQGSVAYVPQQAWIQNATLRDNITFGRPLLEGKYRKVIEACALAPDLDMLPAGDLTEIGEKGINLSGGQKQRVSLARAVYSEADVYLLDDPLSAVDAHVGRHLFERVLGPGGLLADKTRLLATHGLGFLPQTDHVLVLAGGQVAEAGSYAELLAYDRDFAEFLRNYSNQPAEAGAEADDSKPGLSLAEQMACMDGESSTSIGMLSEEDQSHKLAESVRRGSLSGDSVTFDSSTFPERSKLQQQRQRRRAKKKASLAEDGDTLIEEETSKTGTVQLSVFLAYVRAMGTPIFLLVMLLFVLFHLTAVLSNIWLSAWSSEVPPPNGTLPTAIRDRYLAGYTGLGLANSLLLLIASLTLMSGVLRAARVMYSRLLCRVLRAPMAFYDTTPLGRILNRFSRDTYTVDAVLPTTLASYIVVVLRIVATLAVISWSTPIFVSVILPTTVIYYFTQRFYIATSRQLKRLESVSRSPIYSHFSATVAGTSSIRAYRRAGHFVRRNESLVDSNQLTYYPNIASNRWMAIRLEFLGNCLVFFAALFAVIGRDVISSGIVGLSVSYALQITGSLTWMVHVACELETNVVAVERVMEYTEVDVEAPAIVEANRPAKDWPPRGRVEFDHYSVRYREGLGLVLKGITCTFKAKEKIGIVGRTGAGKSSLTLSLFRILEAAGGSIRIDDQDISTMGLEDLRSHITIIPQDPVLFAGTLRMNLDPFDRYSDEALWDALFHSHLGTFVSALPEKLQFECVEGGENLSLGQRQLICLARALLRKTKILVLDEATAAVDLETDDLIQATIRTEFGDCTVITIAHRLNTIMDSSRILVLDEGEIAEFDAPGELLLAGGIFYEMARDAGLA